MTGRWDEIEEGWDDRGSHTSPPEPPCGCMPSAGGHCTEDCTIDCTDQCTIDAISLVGVRGGSGTTTIAAILALHASTMVGAELVAEDTSLVAALLGLTEPEDLPTELIGGLTLTKDSSGTAGMAIVDGGRLDPARERSRGAGERRIGVLRGPCYLALRALLAADHDLDGLIVVAEPGRALNERDVADVTGVPVIATVPVTPAVSRSIDSGLLARRHANLAEFRPLRRWLTLQLDPFPTRSPRRSTAPNHPSMSGTDLLLPPSAKVAGVGLAASRVRPDRVPRQRFDRTQKLLYPHRLQCPIHRRAGPGLPGESSAPLDDRA